MSLDSDDVRTIARLARLRVGDEELGTIAASLTAVLGLAERMRAVDVDGIEPMAHPTATTLRLRPDVVTESDERDALQAPAPQVEDGWFLVPRVLE